MRSLVIGTFRLGKDGGWVGDIRTPGFSQKVRLVPNDNRTHPNAPTFRMMIGWIRVGDAWAARSKSDQPRDYYKVSIDGPMCPAPIQAALFPDPDGLSAELVWRRKCQQDGNNSDDA